MITIESSKNPIVKRLVGLSKKRERQKQHAFLVEGIREVQLALTSGLRPIEICFNNLWQEKELDAFLNLAADVKIYMLSPEAFDRISYRSSVPNVVATFEMIETGLDRLHFKKDALVVVLEQIEKPGNLGAIFRTADAAGIDAIIIANEHGDVFNPNVVRASLGTLFTVPFAIASNSEAWAFLNENAFKVYATYLEATKPHFEVDMTGNTALVMGSEAYGITDFWIEHNSDLIKIPMNGQADSLNVSTASAIAIYEGVRQRSR